ncbi:MAG: DUF2147 domain-containing protein [Pseudomonadota bacterium]
MSFLKRQRSFCFGILVSVLTALATAHATEESDRSIDTDRLSALYSGEWIPPKMDAAIRFEPCGQSMCAVLAWQTYAEGIKTDVLNPNPVLRNRSLSTVRIVEGLKYGGKNKWRGGKLYDPRTGKSYLAKLKVLDSKRIKLSGCISKSLCKGYIWTKAPSVDHVDEMTAQQTGDPVG